MTTETEAPAPSRVERLREIFEAFHAHGAPQAVQTTRYRFELTGEHGGSFMLTLSPSGATWEQADEGDADVTVRLTVDDLIAIADGEIDGRFAVASERIEIEGSLEVAAAMLSQVAPPSPLDAL